MAKSNSGNIIGSWAFLIGVLLAVVFGLLGNGSLDSNVVTILAIIGLIVGLLNVVDEETSPFLMSGAVLIIAGAFGKDNIAGVRWINDILQALLIIFVPATVIVAIKNVFSLAKR